MQEKKEYYFKKNENWYFFDINEFMLKLTSEAPEKAKQSYEGYLKDREHNKKIMMGMISEEDDEKYQEKRLKELEEENLEVIQNEEKNIVKNLFGV